MTVAGNGQGVETATLLLRADDGTSPLVVLVGVGGRGGLPPLDPKADGPEVDRRVGGCWRTSVEDDGRLAKVRAAPDAAGAAHRVRSHVHVTDAATLLSLRPVEARAAAAADATA